MPLQQRRTPWTSSRVGLWHHSRKLIAIQSICVLPRRSLADQLPDSDAPSVAMPALSTIMKIIRNTSIVNSHVFWHMLHRTKLCSAQTIMAKILGLSLNYGSVYLRHLPWFKVGCWACIFHFLCSILGLRPQYLLVICPKSQSLPQVPPPALKSKVCLTSPFPPGSMLGVEMTWQCHWTNIDTGGEGEIYLSALSPNFWPWLSELSIILLHLTYAGKHKNLHCWYYVL